MRIPAKKRENALIGRIVIEVSLALKRRVVQQAQADGKKVNQFLADVLAEHFDNPDFRFIPRLPSGRKARALAKSR